MTVGIVRTGWSGTSGGPGLSQMAVVAAGGTAWTVANANTATAAVRAFWQALVSLLPNELSLSVSPNVDLYDQATATLTGTVTASSTPPIVNGSATGAYAGGVGYKVDWNTGVILGGRRIVGHTYVVPAAAAAFDLDGTLVAGTQSTTTTAANALLNTLSTGSLAMQVWSRPGRKSGLPGQLSAVSGASVRDKSAFQRGRRD